MSSVVLLGLLGLLCQKMLVSGHVLGKASPASDLTQLKSLLKRLEETLTEAVQDEDSQADYEVPDQEPELSRARGWFLDQEGNQESLTDRASPPAEGHSPTSGQRNHLMDLLMTARKRTSGCFGARMDRIGNASGLGCNSGRG